MLLLLLNDLKHQLFTSCSFFSSLQDSMDEACADGIGDEHYRLEGRPRSLHYPHCPVILILLLFIL